MSKHDAQCSNGKIFLETLALVRHWRGVKSAHDFPLKSPSKQNTEKRLAENQLSQHHKITTNAVEMSMSKRYSALRHLPEQVNQSDGRDA